MSLVLSSLHSYIFFSLVMITFKINSLSNFQIGNIVFLTIVAMLYMYPFFLTVFSQ